MIVDLRSDTLTKPTAAMRHAMMEALVGDDVYGEDPTVNQLEEELAAMFGMEAGLFCPSGTMCNQIAIRVHTQPQDEVICDKNSHVYLYEGGGIAYHSLASVQLLEGNRGRLTAAQIADAIRPDDLHFPHTSLVVLENTANKGGGTCYDLAELEAIAALCQSQGLKLHLDGARIFNALIATGQDPKAHGRVFDTISCCLSKGLGAPVGSVLLGSRADITRARKVRKVMGGGMRQAGILAAAGLFALHHQRERLAEDHARAQKLAAWLELHPGIAEVWSVETNLVIFRPDPEWMDTAALLVACKAKGILCSNFGHELIRMVTHLDIGDAELGYLMKEFPV